MAIETSENLSGVRLAERFQLIELLSHGSLSSVYRADDLELRRPVAVKVVPPAHAAHYTAAMRQTSELAHPAAIALFDTLEYNGRLCLVEEYVVARPIGAYIRLGLPAGRATDLILQLARMLSYAHRQGITHGDLSTTAVLVDRHAVLRVNNCGLPPDAEYFRALAQAVMESHSSAAGRDDGIGAPTATDGVGREPWAGIAGDVWAATALFWQLLTQPVAAGSGRREFRYDVPQDLRALVTRALGQGSPETLSADELVLALEGISEELQSAEQQASPLTPPALRAARELAMVEAQHATEEARASKRRLLGNEIAAHDSAFDAPTDPLLPDVAYGEQDNPSLGLSFAPHLRLPSRPLDDPLARYTSLPLTARWEGGGAEAQRSGQRHVSRGGLSLAAVLLLGGVLIVLFFVIGYAMPSIVPH